VQLSARAIRDVQTQEIIKVSGSIIDITQKKQMELELQASENRFRSLMENLNVGVVVFDPTGKIQLFNSKALELLGLTADQLLGKTSFDQQWRTVKPDGSILPPEEHPISLVLKGLQPVRNVVMGVYRQKEDQEDVVWLLVNADPQFDQQRQLLDVVVCFTDISQEYVRTEEKLFSESRYRQIVQTQQNMSWYLCLTPE
jgi:PAS domain S-box